MSDSHLSQLTFDSLHIPDSVKRGIAELGFTRCTPIQAQTLPEALAGRDVAGQAQTGTGKTAAFLVALFNCLLTEPAAPGRPKNGPRAIVIAPTRELAVQIHADAEAIGKYTGLKLAIVFGGVDYEKQRRVLEEGVDVLIGTPGRVIDYFKQHVFDLRYVQVAVMDEADRMFDLGFIKDIRFILRRLPHPTLRLNMMFSATLSHRVLELAYEHMNNPTLIRIEPDKMDGGWMLDGNPIMTAYCGTVCKHLRDDGETWHRSCVFVDLICSGDHQICRSFPSCRVRRLKRVLLWQRMRRLAMVTAMERCVIDLRFSTQDAAVGSSATRKRVDSWTSRRMVSRSRVSPRRSDESFSVGGAADEHFRKARAGFQTVRLIGIVAEEGWKLGRGMETGTQLVLTPIRRFGISWGTETGTRLVLTPIRRSGISWCYAKNSESSTWGFCLSRPEPIGREDAYVPQGAPTSRRSSASWLRRTSGNPSVSCRIVFCPTIGTLSSGRRRTVN